MVTPRREPADGDAADGSAAAHRSLDVPRARHREARRALSHRHRVKVTLRPMAASGVIASDRDTSAERWKPHAGLATRSV